MLKLMSGVEIWVVKVPAAKAIQSLAKPASPSLHHSIQLYPNYLSALEDLGETERSFPQFLAPNSDAKPDYDWILD
jgi:hypothetical protein